MPCEQCQKLINDINNKDLQTHLTKISEYSYPFILEYDKFIDYYCEDCRNVYKEAINKNEENLTCVSTDFIIKYHRIIHNYLVSAHIKDFNDKTISFCDTVYEKIIDDLHDVAKRF